MQSTALNSHLQEMLPVVDLVSHHGMLLENEYSWYQTLPLHIPARERFLLGIMHVMVVMKHT